ncbi:frizzled-9-like [Schistocerca cancellata]|uniref:frizzled-9-like n=1 Tax=Schistocerca cancellata TaxID=274614 RepID=UPI002118DE7E|nr:frizzled-9-like [Schistocerca cancellata]
MRDGVVRAPSGGGARGGGCLCLALLLLTAGGARALRCERINIPACQGLGYNLTTMPNVLGHEDQIQAERALQALLPMVHYNCSRHARLFVCSVFAPLCTPQVAGAGVAACRSLCAAVQRDCGPVLASFSLPWPAALACDGFPEAGLCMHEPPPANNTALPAPLEPAEAERALLVWLPAAHACPPNFVRARDSLGAVTCAPRCGRDAYYRAEDKRFAETWMTGWAWLCFLSTLFTLLTFWVEPARFRYPERPVIFLALCYNLLALGYIVRGALGAAAFSCVQPPEAALGAAAAAAGHVATDGLESGACTLSFLALYYFSLASSAWWLVLAACWFLSAAKKWSCESLHALATYFHLAAWALPAVLAVAALLLRHVAADELTGLCQVSESAAVALVVVPQGALLLAGVVLAALAGAALLRVRAAVKVAGRGAGAGKLERLMTRLGVFCALYALPAAGALACLLYESWHRPRWRALALLHALDCRMAAATAAGPAAPAGCQPQPLPAAAAVEVALLRLFLSLVVGVTSGMWVWSGKTCRAWSKLFTAPRKAHQHHALPLARTPASGSLHVSRV